MQEDKLTVTIRGSVTQGNQVNAIDTIQDGTAAICAIFDERHGIYLNVLGAFNKSMLIALLDAMQKGIGKQFGIALTVYNLMKSAGLDATEARKDSSGGVGYK